MLRQEVGHMAATTTGGSVLGFGESVLERELDRMLHDELDRLLPGVVLEPALEEGAPGRAPEMTPLDHPVPGGRGHVGGSGSSVELPAASMPEPVQVALRPLLNLHDGALRLRRGDRPPADPPRGGAPRAAGHGPRPCAGTCGRRRRPALLTRHARQEPVPATHSRSRQLTPGAGSSLEEVERGRLPGKEPFDRVLDR
jgi:hypothetical protein